DYSAMEFFKSAPALPDLEKLDAVRPVSNGMERSIQQKTWLFQLADRLPVQAGGAGLHQQKRCVLHGAHQIVLHPGLEGGSAVRLVPPERVAVPGDYINFLG